MRCIVNGTRLAFCRIQARKPAAISMSKPRFFSSPSSEKTGSSNYDSAKPFDQIPVLTRLPVIGTAGHQLPSFGIYDLELQYNQYMRFPGDIFREKLGSRDIVVSFNRDDLLTVLKQDGEYSKKLNFQTNTNLAPHCENEEVKTIENDWYHLRDFLKKAFKTNPDALSFLASIHEVSKDFVKLWDANRDEIQEVPDLMKDMYKWALESTYAVGLNTRLGVLDLEPSPESDGKKMYQLLMTQFECMKVLEGFAGSVQLWKSLPLKTMDRYQSSSKAYNSCAIQHFDKAVSDLAKSCEKQHGDLSKIQPTLLMNWLKQGIESKTALLAFLDLLVTGIQTTAHAAGFLLYYLAKNPKKQECMYAELQKEVLPTYNGTLPIETYEKLKYSQACLEESLRLTPVVGGMIRACKDNLVISGYQVPAGTLIALGYQAMSLNENEFDNPEDFVPERFLEDNEQIREFSHLPYGGLGPRACVGRKITQQKVISLVAEILKNYRLEYRHEDVDVYHRITCRTTFPIKLTLIRR